MAQPPVHYAFDPTSQAVLGGIRITHKSHEMLDGVINTASAAVSQATEAGRAAARGGLNYDQFLQGGYNRVLLTLLTDLGKLVLDRVLNLPAYFHQVFSPIIHV